MNPPHPALQNDAILSEIFGHIAESIQHDSYTSLSRSARVCRHFLEPALTALWRELTDLSQLFGILKTSLVKVQNRGRDVYVICGPISSDEWTRFQYYARRVRVLRYSYYGTIGPSIFLQLICHSGGPLLPSLVALYWEQHGPLGTELWAFLSQSLRRVHINYPCDYLSGYTTDLPTINDCTIGSFLNALSLKSPHLHELKLTNVFHPPSLQAITGLTKVQRLHILKSNSASLVLRPCSQMENLVTLVIDLRFVRSGFIITLSGFPALRSLDVSGEPSTIARLCTATSSSAYLQSVKLDLFGNASEQIPHCYDTFNALKSRFASSLRSISVLCRPLSWKDDTHCQHRLLDFTRHLIELCELQEAVISVNFKSVILTNDDIYDMAISWPKLRKLTLLYSRNADVLLNMPSIHSLTSFARHCPQMQELTLGYVLLRRIGPLSACPILSHGLRKLYIEDYVENSNDPLRPAQFLDRMFPNLDINFFRCQGKGAKMPKCLAALQSARKEQMEREKMVRHPGFVPV
ncbi:hypothetical protein AcV5_004131 [Taiwanofungus camphoratus]|nr:hypothetical protein AcV5_004131 [Antrodia cinnamomea]